MYAVIDIGSNTIRLSFYRVSRGKIVALMNRKTVAGLVSYIDKDNNLTLEGVNTLIEVLTEHKVILKGLKQKHVYAFATASLRNIANSESVLKRVTEETELAIDLLSEEEEATFGYLGAVQSVTLKEGLYVDIGGGSTELVFFKRNKIIYSCSLGLGSLNAYVKFVSKLIPTKEEEKEIFKYFTSLLKEVPKIPDVNCDDICGVGGTIRASLRIQERLTRLKSNGYTINDLRNILDRKDYMRYITNILKTRPDRIHTITTGLIILNAIATFYDSKRIYISTYGVREGYLQDKILQIQE
ncbi:MAG: phosphatase [Bacillota bacterium]|jgi:exopolyphosphatase/guanosine-5'-triphosphate,3'-diphosphate pyrophosphatase|nr:phosphatase [Bacillota bacterium]